MDFTALNEGLIIGKDSPQLTKALQAFLNEHGGDGFAEANPEAVEHLREMAFSIYTIGRLTAKYPSLRSRIEHKMKEFLQCIGSRY